MLKEKYLLFLQEHHPDTYNPQYKTYKLKEKLQKEFRNRLKFWAPGSGNQGELVYSNEVPTGEAVEFAFELACSESKRLEEEALILRRNIIDASTLPWPPTAADLKDTVRPPQNLIEFLQHLVSKKTH